MTYSEIFHPDTLDDIENELARAVNKHGTEKTPLNPEMDARDKFVILAEEVGEVARALTYDEGDPEHLYEELIQVATMAAAFAQSLKEESNDQPDSVDKAVS